MVCFCWSAGALFGLGAYFAEDFEKADQYSRTPDLNFDSNDENGLKGLHQLLYHTAVDHPEGDGVCYAIVCRVCLGYPIRTQGRVSRQSRQCKAMDSPDACAGVFANDAAKELKNLDVSDSDVLIPFHSLIAELSDEGIGFVKRFREIVCFHGGE